MMEFNATNVYTLIALRFGAALDPEINLVFIIAWDSKHDGRTASGSCTRTVSPVLNVDVIRSGLWPAADARIGSTLCTFGTLQTYMQRTRGASRLILPHQLL